uniref:NADH-ubiquinone oxidoreductase chain 5 n=1 Tax=Carcinochelis bannaensis TaxID=2126074 RepID=A0A343W8P3_9HEMI|nr:NADH dehydrogenase subunit 5 [Carcinochelis bannaensis]AVZ00733.1 NADH dehydrogenase subunit 5 [Carcinochelis bannaensis]
MKFSLYLLGGQVLFFFGSCFSILGLILLNHNCFYFMDWEFISVNSCVLGMTCIFDWMSLLFSGCVFLISSMVIFYSDSYMSSDLYKIRFYFLVVLFVLSMFLMIISPNLISILLGWDGLGLVSYCLVVYFQNYKSYSAGMLTILTNRLGDVAILISIAWMLNFGSWHFIYYSRVENWGIYLILLVILAGFTSSAQIPFSSWLPAAMAAPTPVSALVHSSTLVTAGVYLIIRFSNMLNFNTWFFLMLGTMTMFMAGLGANFEYDLKKIIALSTLSQLGLMMGILFLGYPIVAFFHLLTHAFFKALLFLCAGLMIHCMSDSQDIRHMGIMASQLPLTCCCFCISNLSLGGLPFLSGFYSKDMILELMMSSYFNFFIFFVFFLSVGLTAAYSLRLVYFCLSFNMNVQPCQSFFEDWLMNKSMFLLTFMSVFAGSGLSWLIFSSPDLFTFSLELKLLPMTFVLMGGWMGYELSFMNHEVLYSMSLYFVSFFSGSMWFMPIFSTNMLYSSVLNTSNSYTEIMDSGWGEYFMSSASFIYPSLLSKWFSFLSENNISILMLSFFFLMFLLII